MEYKSYNEALEAKNGFHEILFYDRTKSYSSICEMRFFSTKESAEKVLKEFEDKNVKIFEEMLEIFKVHNVTRENYIDNSVWNNIDRKGLSDYEKHLFRYHKDNVGYCFIKYVERDLRKEHQEELDYIASMESDDYNPGPYGGAFKDYNDLFSWREY